MEYMIELDSSRMDERMATKAMAARKPNVFQRLSKYFADVRAEFKRVVWPTRPEVVNSSVVVIITLVFFTLFTFLVDQVVLLIIQTIAKIGG
jgi:preprotein translocase subunit SecE